jgi:hypothetical protein
MCPEPNGPGPELEKSLNPPPPTIKVNEPEEVPDAGLRSLDHCKLVLIQHRVSLLYFNMFWHFSVAYSKHLRKAVRRIT